MRRSRSRRARTGRLFLEFALTLAGAVLISGFVALTLTPMMCSKLLKHNPNARAPLHPHRARLHGLRERLHARCSRRRCSVRPLVLADRARRRGAERRVLPQPASPSWRRSEDRGVIRCAARARRARRSPTRRRYGSEVGRHPRQDPRDRLAPRSSTAAPRCRSSSSSRLLKDWDDRERSQQRDHRRDHTRRSGASPACRRSPPIPASFGQRGTVAPVEFVIQTSGTYEQLQEYVDQLLDRIARESGLGERRDRSASSTCPSSASRSTAPRWPISAST